METKKLKPLFIGVLVIIAVAFGLLHQYKEQVSHVGDLGMDDMGRQAFCETVNAMIQDAHGDVRMLCKGLHNQIMVLSLKTNIPIVTGAINPSEPANVLKEPLDEATWLGLGSLVLKGDEMLRRLEDPIPMSEILKRFKNLGGKTVGDFYAACGFEKYIVEVGKDNSIYLELTLSSERYGHNPIEVKR